MFTSGGGCHGLSQNCPKLSQTVSFLKWDKNVYNYQ